MTKEAYTLAEVEMLETLKRKAVKNQDYQVASDIRHTIKCIYDIMSDRWAGDILGEIERQNGPDIKGS